jgi:dihydroflavonol-4-reductase
MAQEQPILVTGASGYIALHVVQQLLQAGHGVRGTVRSLVREAELRAALGGAEATEKLGFVEADLMADAGWDEAVDGCALVVHTASPLPVALPKDADELVVPAREGALRLLRAASAAGVSRVVMTSSVAAVSAGGQRADGQRYSEADWSDADGDIDAYSKSKTLAERAAWDFVAGLPDGQRPELVTINPSVVLGPNLAADHSASVEIVRKLLAREVPGLPRLGWSMVDVRDVAAAHIAALTAPAAPGRRYICSNEFQWMADVARILAKHLAGSGRRVPTRPLPDWLVRLIALFDPAVRRVAGDLGRRTDFDNSAIRRDLDWRPLPIAETITDTADSLIAHGVV